MKYTGEYIVACQESGVSSKPTNPGWTRQPNTLAHYMRWTISTFRLLKDPHEHRHKAMSDACILINLKTGWAWHATI